MNLDSRSLSVSLLGSPGAGSVSVPNRLEPEFEETGGSKIDDNEPNRQKKLTSGEQM